MGVKLEVNVEVKLDNTFIYNVVANVLSSLTQIGH